MNTGPSTGLTAHEIRRVAVESVTDPRTVRRFLAGEQMKSTTATRVRDALTRLGVLRPDAGPALGAAE